MATDWEKDGLLTVVDEADRGGRVKTGTHFSSSDFFKTIGQTIDEILSLLVEAKPQIQLQLSLNCPACRTKPLLARQLWTDYSSRRWNNREDLYRKNTLQSTANIADLPKRGEMIIPLGRQLWLCCSLFLFLHPLQSTECLWRECGRRQCACCCSSSRWKHLGCCAEAGQDEYTLISDQPSSRLFPLQSFHTVVFSAQLLYMNNTVFLPHQRGNGASAGSSAPALVCLWLCFSSPVSEFVWPADPCCPTGGETIRDDNAH